MHSNIINIFIASVNWRTYTVRKGFNVTGHKYCRGSCMASTSRLYWYQETNLYNTLSHSKTVMITDYSKLDERGLVFMIKYTRSGDGNWEGVFLKRDEGGNYIPKAKARPVTTDELFKMIITLLKYKDIVIYIDGIELYAYL